MDMNIDTTIHEELQLLSPFWETLNTQMPYQVPDNYFEMLSSIVRSRIEKEAVYDELELIAPLLNTIPKTAIYQKPTTQKKDVPDASIVKIFSWTKLAVAAAVIGFALLGNHYYKAANDTFDYSAYTTADHHQIIETISDSTLLSYIDVNEELITTPDISMPVYNIENGKSLIEQSSDQELLEYIKSNNLN
jgi:hypothetical protein